MKLTPAGHTSSVRGKEIMRFVAEANRTGICGGVQKYGDLESISKLRFSTENHPI
jgi:hypothetical protein